MRILYICDALAIYGGLERVVVEKVNWLVEHGGCDVSLLTVNQGSHHISFPLHPDVLYDDLNICFYQQYHLPFWRRLIRKRQLQQQFRLLLGEKVQSLASDVIVCTCLDYVRDVVKIKGGEMDYFVIGRLDIEKLRRFQSYAISPTEGGEATFKPVPCGFKISDSRKVLPQ